MQFAGPVTRLRDHIARRIDHNGTHRHLAARTRRLCFAQGHIHERSKYHAPKERKPRPFASPSKALRQAYE
ncbi:hypothetical protein NBRC116593_06060 [Sulfitobacter pacificus]